MFLQSFLQDELLAKISFLLFYFSIDICDQSIHNNCDLLIVLYILFCIWVSICNQIVENFQLAQLSIFAFGLSPFVLEFFSLLDRLVFQFYLFLCLIIYLLSHPLYHHKYLPRQLMSCHCQLGWYFYLLLQVLLVFFQFRFVQLFHSLVLFFLVIILAVFFLKVLLFIFVLVFFNCHYHHYSYSLLLLLLLGRPPGPYSMLIIGWWYFIPEQQLQVHQTMSLYYVELLLCTPSPIHVLASFLRALPHPCLSSPLRPIPPLPLPSSSSPPNLDRPVPITSWTPSPPASDWTAHRGP